MAVPRRAKRFLTAEQKYDLWQRMLTGQITTVEAAAEAGIDRSTVMTLRKTARDGAIAALQASRPGRPKKDRVEAAEVTRQIGPTAALPVHLLRPRLPDEP
jgi:transposase-like protein